MSDRRNSLLDDLVGAAVLGIFIWIGARFWKVTLVVLFIGWVIGLVIDIRDDSDGNARQGYLWLAGLVVVVGVAVVLRLRGRRRRQRLAQEAVERRARLGLPDRY